LEYAWVQFSALSHQSLGFKLKNGFAVATFFSLQTVGTWVLNRFGETKCLEEKMGKMFGMIYGKI
jgi:hypothetical protein